MSRPSRGDHDYLVTAAEGTKLLDVTSEPRNRLKLIFAFKTRFNVRPFSKKPKKKKGLILDTSRARILEGSCFLM